jgi:hypothetical protein
MNEAYALFIVILTAYAEPKTDPSHMDVRMPSMMVVGPKQYATAKTPYEAAVPWTWSPNVTSSIAKDMPMPQIITVLC